MPTGHKTIVWTAANDERLLLSILAVHNDIKVDSASVAQVFGKNFLKAVRTLHIMKKVIYMFEYVLDVIH